MNVCTKATTQAVFGGLAGLLSLAGVACSIPPAEAERERRDELAQARARYRPDGARPALPVLATDSPSADVAAFAVLNSPRVEAAFHVWAQAVAEIAVARSLPDPSLSLEIEAGRMLEAVRPGLLGSYPGPGKLTLAAEAQSLAAAAARHEFEHAAVEAALRARTGWLRAAWLSEVIVRRRAVLGLLQELEDLASAQFRVDKVSQQDVLRVQIERDQLETEIASLEDSRALLQAELRAALGILPDAPPPPLPERMPADAASLPGGELLDQALRENHRLAALREEIRQAEALVTLARKGSQPDFMAWLRVDLLSPVMVSPEVSATLPIYRDKIAATVAATLASRQAADARLSGATLDVVVQLADAHFRFRDASRRLELVRDKLLPKAEAALDAGRAAYQTGMADMTGLLDAERSLLEFRIEEVTSRLERELALAEIAFVVLGARALEP